MYHERSCLFVSKSRFICTSLLTSLKENLHVRLSRETCQVIGELLERNLMHRLELTGDDMEKIKPLLAEVASRHDSVETLDFLDEASTYAQELPRGLRAFLNEFRVREPAGVCLVSGYPVDDLGIGETPSHWRNGSDGSLSLEEEIFLNLCGALLGEAIGWAHQRDGLICQDLMPIEGHENEMLGSGSKQDLVWHTEDARYAHRGDYIGLMCLRNPDAVPTTFTSVDELHLDLQKVRPLFEPRFVFLPDPSHPEDTGGEEAAILFGDPELPYLRFDPYSMQRPETEEERSAFDYLIRVIDESTTGLALQAGDLLFIDNYKTVHGRSSFKPRFDGTDRWLKRINITRDLRKSRNVRASQASRIIL